MFRHDKPLALGTVLPGTSDARKVVKAVDRA
jgi:hypothetical protein